MYRTGCLLLCLIAEVQPDLILDVGSCDGADARRFETARPAAQIDKLSLAEPLREKAAGIGRLLPVSWHQALRQVSTRVPI